MPKRLAITIAGAVSLGSYEAGVLYEVLDAIHQHNSVPAMPDEQRIKIDVLTGASSGGMTAAIMAHKMLYAADEFLDPYDNPLYNVWVKRVDLAGLVATEDEDSGDVEPAMRSIFSSNLVEQVLAEILTDRYLTGEWPKPVTHLAAATSISLGMTLTNLNGVDYAYEMQPGRKFTYTRHDDEMMRVLSVGGTDNVKTWEEIRSAAVASGAFPLAFRTKELERHRGDYRKGNLEPWTSDSLRFTYTDGAMLQSEPLGMAKRLVNEIDEHWNNDSRFYLFVTPHGKTTSADASFCEENADYLNMMKRLAKVVLAQSEFEDWIRAEEVNQQIALLDARARDLAESLRSGEGDVVSMKRAAEDLLRLLFQQPKNGGTRRIANIGSETLNNARMRIEHQYKEELASLGEGSERAAAFRDTTLGFEKAANLGDRDYMRIYGMTVSEDQLAGAELTAFLGFFDQRYRDHDYDRGRLVARAVLNDPVLSQPGELGPVRYTPTRTNPIDSSLNGMLLRSVPMEEQEIFREGIKRRVNAMVRELIGIWSYAADIAVIDPIMNAILNQVFETDRD